MLCCSYSGILGVVMACQPAAAFVFLTLCCIELVVLSKFHKLTSVKKLKQNVDESDHYAEGDGVAGYPYAGRGYKVQFQDLGQSQMQMPLIPPTTTATPSTPKIPLTGECTADKLFVFAVHHDIAAFPIDPTSLVVVGRRGCNPVIVNREFAIFKFSATECGSRSYEIGETVVYEAEVQTIIKALNLKYGIISRITPIRIMVECRYPKGKLPDAPMLARAGYMVMSPSLPSSVTSAGLFGVQLRISKDKTYSKFYPQYHQPLNVLLGKSVYLEVRLMSPKPTAVLLVNYCLAYPRSAKKALILLYEGCPNHLDTGTTSILYVSDLPQNRHQRRFEVKAFQFMEQANKKYLDEEIYFMCSTEVCMPSVTYCRQTCFDGQARP